MSSYSPTALYLSLFSIQSDLHWNPPASARSLPQATTQLITRPHFFDSLFDFSNLPTIGRDSTECVCGSTLSYLCCDRRCCCELAFVVRHYCCCVCVCMLLMWNEKRDCGPVSVSLYYSVSDWRGQNVGKCVCSCRPYTMFVSVNECVCLYL